MPVEVETARQLAVSPCMIIVGVGFAIFALMIINIFFGPQIMRAISKPSNLIPIIVAVLAALGYLTIAINERGVRLAKCHEPAAPQKVSFLTPTPNICGYLN